MVMPTIHFNNKKKNKFFSTCSSKLWEVSRQRGFFFVVFIPLQHCIGEQKNVYFDTSRECNKNLSFQFLYKLCRLA